MNGSGWRECGAPGGVRWLEPRNLPAGVRVAATLRAGGVSAAPYASLNLAAHVDDAPGAVEENRRRARAALELPAEPLWLRQVHGTRILDAGRELPGAEADGAVTRAPGVVLAVLTADCLPIVFASRAGPGIAVAHAGWRGLAGGVVEAALDALGTRPGEVAAWIAPGIGAAHYVVGDDVRAAFRNAPGAGRAFAAAGGGRWHCDLAGLVHARLAAAGVTEVTASGVCTYADPDSFYSYRRDGQSGRMATFAWREAAPGDAGA